MRPLLAARARSTAARFGELLRLRAGSVLSLRKLPSRLPRSSSLGLSSTTVPGPSSPMSDATNSAGTSASLPGALASTMQPALANDPARAVAAASVALSLLPPL